jgi:hypothetical protein
MALLCLALAACQRHGDDRAALYGRWHAPPAAAISLDDPRSSYQLLDGFLAADGQGWRWTQRRFAVLLAVPGTVGRLELVGRAPQPKVTLRCSFAGRPLPAALLEPGQAATWPVETPGGDTAVLDCEVDPIVRRDGMELGIEISRIALQ